MAAQSDGKLVATGTANARDVAVARFDTDDPDVADLSVSLTHYLDPVGPDDFVSYTATVTNHGPGAATRVALTERLPRGVVVEGVYISNDPEGAGPCTHDRRRVTCPLGGLASGASASVSVVLEPGLPRSMQVSARVTTDDHDPHRANNRDVESTRLRHSPE